MKMFCKVRAGQLCANIKPHELLFTLYIEEHPDGGSAVSLECLNGKVTCEMVDTAPSEIESFEEVA